ncbi:hypothetical protein HanRHA438_Chr12g0535771 [Helianthus annuus]|nr:hypothetical protein HanRHA438_Chr12g0535771 [Helianthus annuus]
MSFSITESRPPHASFDWLLVDSTNASSQSASIVLGPENKEIANVLLLAACVGGTMSSSRSNKFSVVTTVAWGDGPFSL